MKITYVAAECAPFAASGGLGDVMGALPQAVKAENPSIDVSVILPYYDSIKEKFSNNLKKICDIQFYLSWRHTGASVYAVNKNEIKYYFIENDRYFKRGRLYGEEDDAERFAFFSLAVLEFIKSTGNTPDILHANDWQTALCVVYLKTMYKTHAILSKIRTLYTIHNIEYQGRFGLHILSDVLGLDSKYLNSIEYDGDINLMKGALSLSDYISTVSPNYRDELHHDFFAFGLAPIINSVSHKMCGIINGIDYDYFSPEADREIYFSYNKDNVKEGKLKNKIEFGREMGLEVSKETPLIVMIGRLTATKGVDLVLHILEELLSHGNVQIAILGTGEEQYEKEFIKLSYKYENMVSIIKFDRAISKKMYAAGDMFLMPSKSEPCGLAQMIACSYGCVPIVRSVGGLYDTINHWDGKNGNGFCFNNYNAHELLFTIKDAIGLFNSENWERIRYNAITSRFEWSDSAKKYISIYNNLLNW